MQGRFRLDAAQNTTLLCIVHISRSTHLCIYFTLRVINQQDFTDHLSRDAGHGRKQVVSILRKFFYGGFCDE
jgi:hypothetical protein